MVIVIMDGAADRGVRALNNATPLHHARHENIDGICTLGMCGLMYTIAPGVAPGSDTAHLAILGYNPYENYCGRGPYEALGAGFDLKPGDIAFRANLATIERGKIVDRRAGRISTEEARELLKDHKTVEIDGVEFIIEHTVEHRAVVVIRDHGLCSAISDTDPHRVGVPPNRAIPFVGTKDCERTALLVNKYTAYMMDALRRSPINRERKKRGLPPANAVLLRGAGAYKPVASIKEVFGIRGACISGVALVRGVARALGMRIFMHERITGGKDTDVGFKAELAIKLLENNYDLVLLNIKMTDIYGHDGDFRGKVEAIERIDREIAPLLNHVMDYEHVLALTSDHATPVSVREHTADPVPLLVYAPSCRTDTVKHYSEVSVASGALGVLRGTDLIRVLLDQAGIGEKFGE